MNPRRREILIFEVGGRRLGLPASEVRELVRAVAIVPLPLAPRTIEGVVNLRGTIVPVLDVRPRLRLPAQALDPSDHLIIASCRGRLIAIRVDRAVELLTVADDLDAEEGHGGGGAGDRRPSRVARLGDGLAPILDLEDLLGPDEAETLARLLAVSASSIEVGG